MTIIDVTAMGREPQVMESKTWGAIPEYDAKPESYLVRWSEILNKAVYGRVYPNCPSANKSHTDECGDFLCNHKRTVVIYCGCARPGWCPMHYADKDDHKNGIDYAEYVRRYES